jgi:hypothetical protein
LIILSCMNLDSELQKLILALVSPASSCIRQLGQCIRNTASDITKFFTIGSLCIQFYKQHYLMTNPSMYQSPLPLISHLTKYWIPGINNVTLSTLSHHSSYSFNHSTFFLFTVLLFLLKKFKIVQKVLTTNQKLSSVIYVASCSL